MAGFVPANSTWKYWQDAGFPENTNTPTSGGTVTYQMCSGTTATNVNVGIVLLSVTTEEQFVNGKLETRTIQEWRVQSNIPVTEDVEVYVTNWVRGSTQNINCNGFLDVENDDFIDSSSNIITIPSGSTVSSSFEVDAEPNWLNYNLDENNCSYQFQASFSIAAQPFFQPCSVTPPPPTCQLEITGVTTTNETFIGDEDGTITVGVSGVTGSTTYILNGVISQTGNTFTGLTEGTYTIRVEDGSCFDTDSATISAGEFRSGAFTVLQPNTFLASENPIITQIGTAINGSAQFAQSTFTFTTGVTNNGQVIFSLTSPIEYTATFTARDFPNRANYFVTPTLKNRIGTIIGSNTAAEIATTFADAVQKDVTLSKYYFIDTSGATVILTAKQATARLTLDTSNVTVPAGVTLTTVVEGNDQYQGSIVADYSIYTDVYVGESGTQYGVDLSTVNYDNYTSLQLPFLQNNIHRFDVSNVMKNFVSTPKINLNFTGFTYINSMIRPFYLKYGEVYPLVPNENTKKKRKKGDTGYKWVLNSSLDLEEANDVSQYFTGGSFLTNSPNPLKIQRNQTNFLYFILPKDYGQPLTLKGDIDYYDGTSQTGQTFINIATGSTNLGGVYALNTSYSALGLAAYEASGNTKIKRITFAIYGSGSTAISEEKIYRFEIDEQPRRFGVSFLNKLGAYDTFDFSGIVEDSIERDNKTYTTPRTINFDGSSPQGFKSQAMYDTQVTKTITVNSGWIDSAHFDWLIELLSSNNIYSYTEDNQNYLNVIGFDYNKSSLEDLFEIEVTFRLTTYENNISI